MIISPQTAIKEGWVTWTDAIIDIEKHIQPDALDFDCATIARIDKTDVAFLSEASKKLRRSIPLNVISTLSYGDAWELEDNQCYDFMSNFYVNLPIGVAATLIIRSTLNRCGTFLTSGLYDSGFNGHVSGMLHIRGGNFLLAPNTRIGQIIFKKSESSGKAYSGSYSHEFGSHWSTTTNKTTEQ